MTSTLPVLAQPAAAGSIERIAGVDRYATAAAVSASTHAPGAPVAYVATGASFPDALAGGPAAAKDGGPVLLTAPGTLPAATKDELQRLQPGRIVVLGGPSVVKDAVLEELEGHTGGSVTRIAGADRYTTAALISKSTFPTGVKTAYVTTGTGFADALAGGAAAGAAESPVLLTAPNTLPAATREELTRLKPQSIVVLGGPSIVWPSTEDALRAYTAGSVTRAFGPDRYSTSAAVSRKTFANGADTVFLATGASFPDALAGGPAAAESSGPLMLVAKDCVPGPVMTELKRLNPSRIVLLGSTGVVGQGVAEQRECPQSGNPEPGGTVAGGPARNVVVEGPDYASDVHADPWDYSNKEDVHVGTPQMSNGGEIRGGLLTYTTATQYPWMDPIPYLPGSMPLERDGPRAPVDTAKYTHVSMRMSASQAGAGILVWNTCDWSVSKSCSGATGVAVKAGWNTYDVKLAPTDRNLTAPWSGKGLGLRFIPNDKEGVQVKVDWMRIHGSAAPVRFTFTPADPGKTNEVVWDSDGSLANNTTDQPGWGVLGTSTGSTYDFPVATYPAGTYRLYTRGGGKTGPYTEPLLVIPRPRADVESPSLAGGADYATSVRKNAWDFSGLDDVGRNVNVCNKRILPGGVLAANNCGAEIDNPFIFLPNPTPIDGNTWNRLTIRLRYDGVFGLTGGPTGGAVARLIWYVKSDSGRSDQNIHDIVVYPGWQEITVDLKSDPAWLVTDETQKATRIGWSNQTITSLRLDPNEDVSERKWYVDSVRLTREDAGRGQFDVRFKETSGLGGTAKVYLDRDRGGNDGVHAATHTITGGSNVVRTPMPAGLANGRYWPYVVVTGPSGTTTEYADAPVQLTR